MATLEQVAALLSYLQNGPSISLDSWQPGILNERAAAEWPEPIVIAWDA